MGQSPHRVVVPYSHIQSLPSQDNHTRFGSFFFVKVLYYDTLYLFLLQFEKEVLMFKCIMNKYLNLTTK